METNSNTDNFEQLLRETTDQFRMYPSRRVWHSIYNDLHPARKWPSVAVLLLLITSIMYVGVTNSNETVAADKSTAGTNIITAELVAANTGNITNAGEGDPISSLRSGSINGASPVSSRNNNIAAHQLSTAISTTGVARPMAAEDNSTIPSRSVTTIHSPIVKADEPRLKNNENVKASINNTAVTTGTDDVTPAAVTSNEMLTNGVSVIGVRTSAPGTVESTDASSPAIAVVKKNNPSSTAAAAKETVSKEDRSWMDDYVLYNKKPGRKWKNRLAYQVYVTPSVGYRSLEKNTSYSVTQAASLINNPAQIVEDYSMNHYSAINLEAGTNIIFSFSKKLRLKAGMQFNYTNYRINAYDLNHPTFTTLMLNDLNFGYPVLALRTTTLANTPGPASRNLNNNTYQLSIPLGADFKIAGNNQLKWYAGATVQPTYIAGGHSYLISSDLKNYVAGEGFMRKFNLNGGVETFISYKTSNGLVLSAGPQLRYQFLSTYTKEYTYDEKLYNLGVKLGMTTNF